MNSNRENMDSHNLNKFGENLLNLLNQLSNIVYSLSESTRTAYGFYNRKTFESEFRLTWKNDTENEVRSSVRPRKGIQLCNNENN